MKKLLLVLLALVVVVVGVAVYLISDINRFKPQIESAVAEQTGRRLNIQGDLGLSFYPRLALSLPPTTLSGPKGEGEPLRIGGASVDVALMPLLSGRLEADVIRLEGLRAEIVRYEDGSTSLDDLIAGGEPAQAPASEGQGTGFPLSEIRIGGIALTDAQVRIEDRQAGNTIELTGVNLEAGAIGPGQTTPLTLAAGLTTTAPPTQLAIRLEGELQPDVQAATLAAPTLALEVRGSVDGMPVDQTLAFSGLRVDAQAVAAEAMSLSAALEQAPRQVALRLSSPLRVELAGPKVELPKLQGAVRIDDRAVAPEPLELPFTGSLGADVGAETAALALAVSAPDTQLDAKVDVKGFAGPTVRFSVDADKIDVDRYLPAQDAAATGGSQPGGAGGTQAPPTAVDDIPIDLSPLAGLDVAGTVRIGALRAAGLSATDVSAELGVAGGAATLKMLRAALYDGRFDIRGAARMQGNRLEATSNLVGVNIGPLLTDLTGDTLLEGQGDVAFDLKSSGATVGAVRRNLNGAARVSLKDGAVLGINLGQKLREAKDLLQGAKAQAEAIDRTQKTDFATLSASFTVREGVAHSDDLDGKSPLLRLEGSGKIDLVRETLDYTVRASAVATAKGQGGRDLEELRGVTIPVHLTGPFAQPQWKIDWAAIAEQALKSRAAEKLEERLAPEKARAEARLEAEREKLKAREDELKDKAREKLGEQLKGLLQR